MTKICNYLNSKNEKTINKAMLDLLFPIGKIEMFYDDVDHSNYCGFTWELCLKERSPIGVNADSTEDRFKNAGNQFGEKEHTLSVNEIPNMRNYDAVWTNRNLSTGGSAWGYTADENTEAHQAIKKGGGQAHNNIHPVETVSFWKRIA